MVPLAFGRHGGRLGARELETIGGALARKTPRVAYLTLLIKQVVGRADARVWRVVAKVGRVLTKFSRVFAKVRQFFGELGSWES